ncbi:MAG: hypothetical protein JW776_07025 [Candidatus Lokiarchaeota archaeon]|nr:hypothetical protein [Candidatus Lokiarchaeota archaeon]
MENLIKAKDEQIAKLNDLKELLKQQILSLQEENTKLKNELFEMEEILKQIPEECAPIPDYQSMFTAITAKLNIIVEKLDELSMAKLEPFTKSQGRNITPSISTSKKQDIGLIKPSSLFSPSEVDPQSVSSEAQLYKELVQKPPEFEEEPTPNLASFNAADPRSLQRQVVEIDYPENGIIQCPKCGKMECQEMPDPGRGSFAKKYYCKKCRQEWRYRY